MLVRYTQLKILSVLVRVPLLLARSLASFADAGSLALRSTRVLGAISYYMKMKFGMMSIEKSSKIIKAKPTPI